MVDLSVLFRIAVTCTFKQKNTELLTLEIVYKQVKISVFEEKITCKARCRWEIKE